MLSSRASESWEKHRDASKVATLELQLGRKRMVNGVGKRDLRMDRREVFAEGMGRVCAVRAGVRGGGLSLKVWW